MDFKKPPRHTPTLPHPRGPSPGGNPLHANAKNRQLEKILGDVAPTAYGLSKNQRAPLRSVNDTPPTTAAPQADKKSIDITINFASLPKLSKLSKLRLPSQQAIRQRLRQFTASKKALAITSGVVILGTGALVAFIYSRQAQSPADAATPTTAAVATTETTAIDGEPAYDTLLPKDKKIEDLGGWSRISPPESAPVFTYSDSIGDIAINISQQELPKSFVENRSHELSELAKKFNATTELNANGTKLYIGTSSKGPQSVLFIKNELLVMIKSQQRIEDSAWITYISALD